MSVLNKLNKFDPTRPVFGGNDAYVQLLYETKSPDFTSQSPPGGGETIPLLFDTILPIISNWLQLVQKVALRGKVKCIEALQR